MLDAVHDGVFGRMGEQHAVWGKERAGVFASDIPVARHDEVGGSQFR